MQRYGVIVVVLALLGVGVWFLLSNGESEDSAGKGPPPVGVPMASSHPTGGGGGEQPAHGMKTSQPENTDSDDDDEAAGRDGAAVRTALMDPRLAALAKAFAAADRAARAGVAAEPPPAAAKAYVADRDGIKTAMTSAIPAMKECFESWLAVNPDVGGKVTVRFRIEADDDAEAGDDDGTDDGADPEVPAGKAGVVDAAVSGGGLGNVLLDGCIINAVGDLRFEGVESGGLTVNYPFNFAVEGATSPPPDAAPTSE